MSHAKLYWLHTLSPTHVGTGQGIDYIDLPIDRDGVTNWPIVRGSGFKGVWRDWATQHHADSVEIAFGKADGEDHAKSNSGSLIPTDARLVCMPVRSFRGTFAWVTSPLCLNFLGRTLKMAGSEKYPEIPGPLETNAALTCSQTALDENGAIYLEDLNLNSKISPLADAWSALIAGSIFGDDPEWQEIFKKRFVIVSDQVFDYITEMGTEVNTRIKIDEATKIVANGQLWVEESIPAETILVGLIHCDRVFSREKNGLNSEELLKKFTEKSINLQIGGKATVGRGQVNCIFSEIKEIRA